MKIGLVIFGDIGAQSGGYLYDRKLVEYLRAAGDEVEIISQRKGNWISQVLENFDADLRQRLRLWDGDVLLEDELNHAALFRLNGRIRAKLSYPIVGLVHHLRSSERHPALITSCFYRPVERAFLRTVDAFIFNSRNTKTEVLDLVLGKDSRQDSEGGIPHVIARPSGGIRPGPEEFATGEDEAGLRILFVGSIDPRKNLKVLLKALLGLRRRGSPVSWTLGVVGSGDGAYERSCRRLARRLGSAVHWHGQTAGARLEALYRSHNVLSVVSDFEGFGIVYLEAMAFGLVPIGADRGGAVEVIGDAGLLIPPRDVTALVRALENLADPAVRAGFSRRALARSRLFPDWETSFGTLRDFLVGLVRDGKSVRESGAQ